MTRQSWLVRKPNSHPFPSLPLSLSAPESVHLPLPQVFVLLSGCVCFSVAVYVYTVVPAWLPVCQPMF